MKLQKEFKDFYSHIRIDTEANALIEKRLILEEDIRSNLPSIFDDNGIALNKSDIRMIDQGSYKYKTTIRTKVVDRDVALILPLKDHNSFDPRTIKGYLKDSITIPSRTVVVKEPCVRAEYYKDGEEWLHIDIPLYAEDGSQRYLARGKANSQTYSWEIADPEGLNKYLCDRICGNEQLRRIICFIKRWRDEVYSGAQSSHEIPPSIGLTLLACDCFSRQSSNDGDDDLLSFKSTMSNILGRFSVVKNTSGNIIDANVVRELPVAPWTNVFKKMSDSSKEYMRTFYKRLSKAVDNLTDAVNLESEHDAAKLVQKVLGDDFTVPPKEATAASTKNNREHSFG